MAIIPAPLNVTPRAGALHIGPNITVSYDDPVLAPVTERFCADLERRTGIRSRATPGGPGVLTVGLGDIPEGHTAPLGIQPAGHPADESHTLTISSDGVLVLAREPAGAARALTSLLQLLAVTPPAADGGVTLAARHVADAPRFAWRGLSLDVARRFFTAAQIRQVIDLLALYKLNVLHLHLTDDDAWRVEPGRPAGAREPDGTFYTGGELRELVGYAADRFVAIVPEVDSPGHAAAFMKLRPELRSGRNQISYERAGGTRHRTAWLDPEVPGAVAAIADVFAELAEICPGPFVHVGGDEAWRMPEDAYQAYVRQLLAAVRDLGKRPVGWQELVRADAGEDTGIEAIQYWMSPASFESLGEAGVPPETAAMVAANAARTRGDIEQALLRQIPVIMSPSAHCYLDVPYADESADPAQAARRSRVGLRNYRPLTLPESFGWEPVAELGAGARARDVGGIEAAMWCETVQDFDDLTFALLPRLAGVAEKAWGTATSWAEHRDALGRHGRLWTQDGLTFFRAEGVSWL
jgi:hexosaminidase